MICMYVCMYIHVGGGNCSFLLHFGILLAFNVDGFCNISCILLHIEWSTLIYIHVYTLHDVCICITCFQLCVCVCVCVYVCVWVCMNSKEVNCFAFCGSHLPSIELQHLPFVSPQASKAFPLVFEALVRKLNFMPHCLLPKNALRQPYRTNVWLSRSLMW